MKGTVVACAATQAIRAGARTHERRSVAADKGKTAIEKPASRICCGHGFTAHVLNVINLFTKYSSIHASILYMLVIFISKFSQNVLYNAQLIV